MTTEPTALKALAHLVPLRSLPRPGPLRPAAVVRTALQLGTVTAVAVASSWAAGGDPDGAGGGPLGLLTLIMGGLTCLLTARAAVRHEGAVRWTWGAVALAQLPWTAFLFGAVNGWPGWLTWGVLRLGCYATAMGAVLGSPGVRRRRVDWLMLLLEGWLVSGSAVMITWLALGRAGHTLGETMSRHSPALPWAVLGLTTATTVAGLTLRAQRRAGWPVVYVAAGVQIGTVADLSWAATGEPRVGVGIYLVMSACLCAATMAPRLGLWGDAAAPDRVNLGRPSHVAVVPGLFAAILARHDVLAVVLSCSLVLVLGLEMLLRTAVVRMLWDQAKAQAERLDTVLRESRDAILVIEPGGLVAYANPATADILGHAPEQLIGTPFTGYLHPDDLPGVTEAFARLGAGAERGSAESLRLVGRCRRASGAWRHIESTVSSRRSEGAEQTIVVARDVEERVRLEGELRSRAETDALTGLLNRQAFLTALQAHLRAGPMAVLFCDLDGFKAVNDTEGHASGDALLRRAGETIAQTVRPGQLVARLGGDEFAVLVPPGPWPAATGLESVEQAAQSVGDALVTRLGRTRRDGRIGVSIGVAVSAGPGARPAAGDSDRAQEILRDADLAMYEAKAAGGSTWVRFEPAMRDRVIARSQLLDDLERAIAEGGLSIDLQPIVDVASGAWSQFEALVRWQDGGRRRSPAEFLPVAEESGLMVPLGAWVLRASLEWLAGWPDAEAGVSVNVTGVQVAHRGFVEMVCNELVRHHISPERLTLEITEQTAVEDLDRASAVLQPLRQLGVHVALDDFGTGFCSLGYLAQLPVDELKIDRQFVDGLGTRREDDALVRAVLGLASDLGLRVVAEGVETQDQAQILTSYGCPLVQGYLYARPAPAGQLCPPSPATVPADATPVPRQAGPGRAVGERARR